MKKILALLLIACCLLSGCTDAGGVDVGDIDVGDIDVGNIDVGDIDVGNLTTGIYVKVEPDDIYSVEWKCGSQKSGKLEEPGRALDTGVFLLLVTPALAGASESEGAPADFTVTAKKENGEVFAEDTFTCAQGTARVELTVTLDGKIQE